MRKIPAILLVFCCTIVAAQQTYKPDGHGEKLKQFYLSLDVEHLWLAGQRIDWETGIADANDHRPGKEKTHCSAFAAAACTKLNIYILSPPEKPHLLANAQYDWLKTKEAKNQGWRHIEGDSRYGMAQDYANKGYVVVAVAQNPDPYKHGHTALVTPAIVTDSELVASGPKLIMAGARNYNRVSLKTGFKRHLTTWPENVIEFYYFKDPVF